MADVQRPAYRCPWCYSLGDDDPMPAWRVERQGDAVVSWACDAHLGIECGDLQRLDHPAPTVLIIKANSAHSDATASVETTRVQPSPLGAEPSLSTTKPAGR